MRPNFRLKRTRRRIATKVLDALSLVSSVAVFGLALITLSPILPTRTSFVSYIISSGSMEPTVMTGAMAFVRPGFRQELKPGDIAAFLSPLDGKTVVMHRITERVHAKGYLSYRTAGDNNNAPDAWSVPNVSIVGKYLFSVPYLGYAANAVRTPIGFGVLIGIPALILVIQETKLIIEGVEEELAKRASGKRGVNGPILFVFLGLVLLSSSCTAPRAMGAFTSRVRMQSLSLSCPRKYCKKPHGNAVTGTNTVMGDGIVEGSAEEKTEGDGSAVE